MLEEEFSSSLPSQTTSLGPISYGVDESFLTPQLSFPTDLVQHDVTADLARPRSSSGFYHPNLDDMKPRRSSASFYSPNLEDATRTSNQGNYFMSPAQDLIRPRSSASIPLHGTNEFGFTNNTLGIKQEAVDDLNFTNSPHFSSRPNTPYFPNFGLPEVSVSPPKKAPVPIRPNPIGLRPVNSQKRARDEESPELVSKRRRRSSASHGNSELNEEERLLLRLKDEENLPWKDIALRFQLELGKNHQVPALQMRYKRLREKLRVWTDSDVQALAQARDYWEKFKWDIISTKMLDFGCTEKWPPKYCIRKWEEQHPPGDPREPTSAKGSEVSDRGSPEYGLQ
ncbi:MAG: hypothetical protein M1837_001973 [Sclerophora amabilis]|nr:MAG: hypothetical protein M1837_001973 [Sclerophora amabilis]